jgi:hypothetical protein
MESGGGGPVAPDANSFFVCRLFRAVRDVILSISKRVNPNPEISRIEESKHT